MAIEKCFIQAGYREKGEVFEFTGTPEALADSRCLVKVGKAPKESGAPDAPTEDKGPTKAEIMVQLTAAGVTFDNKANKPELLALLKETIEKIAPGASTKDSDLTDKTE
jgi:hypothetical protein